jgi:2'-5' RNA ligase
MAFAVTLRLDDETAAPVERIWRALADRTGDDDALRLGYPPHLTLAVLPDSVAIASGEEVVFELIDAWDAVPLTLAGFGVFPVSPPVVWIIPVVTELLLARHGVLHAALAPHTIDPYHRPGAWVPHITLSHGTRSVARAIEVASSLWSGPIKGWADRVDLVRFHPVEVLRSKILRPLLRQPIVLRIYSRRPRRPEKGNCSTRLNDSFSVQDSTNRLVGVEPASCCRTHSGSNGGEQISAPV